MQYRQISPARRRYVVSLLNLALEAEQADQAQAVLKARLIAMAPARRPARPQPRRKG